MILRNATPKDAAAIATLLQQSIRVLCLADHKNDPQILAKWADSKTPELLAIWIADPTSTFLVAEEGETLLAVGSVSVRGEIGHNYVAPEARFRGISRAMITALEALARKHGLTHCTLSSTGTARRFYLSMGYQESPVTTGLFGTTVYPMVKELAPGG